MTSCYHIFNKLASYAMCLIWQNQIRMFRFLTPYNYSIDRTIIVNENLIGFIICVCLTERITLDFARSKMYVSAKPCNENLNRNIRKTTYCILHLKERSLSGWKRTKENKNILCKLSSRN